MYRVVHKFKDLQDSERIYEVGDSYPREGYEPSAKRIKELSTMNNKINKIIIKAVEINVEPQEEPKTEDVDKTTTTEETPLKTTENEEEKPKKRRRRKKGE